MHAYYHGYQSLVEHKRSLGKTQPSNTLIDINTNVQSNGTHDPSDVGVPIATSVQLDTEGISCVITNL